MDKLAEVKLAAFVDELVKIAFDMEDPSILVGVAGLLNDAQVEMLKQAGMWDAIKGVAGRAGKAIGGMGERGVASRMGAAGAAHDLEMANLNRLMKGPAGARPGLTAAQAAEVVPMRAGRGAGTHWQLSTPFEHSPAAGLQNFNPQAAFEEASRNAARRAAAVAPAAAAPAAAPAAAASPGIMQRLRGMIPSGGGGLQPAFAV